MGKYFAAVALGLMISGCQAPASPPAVTALAPMTTPDAPDSGEGRQYIDALVREIGQSERIVVTEHSFDYDAFDPESGESLLPEPITYSSKELTSQNKRFFLFVASKLAPETQHSFSACTFEPHHTVRFFNAGIETSTMRVCFGCGQVKWSGSKVTPPQSLVDGLHTFIGGIGMRPVRNWKALARERLE